DKTLTRTPEILATLRDGVAALPQLLTALESGAACAIDTAPIIARAHALAARQELGAADTEGGETTSAMRVTATAIAAATDVRSAAAGPAGPVTTADGTDSDPALREIFSR